MNKKYLCALALFCTFSMNSLVAQSEEVSKARLFVTYKKSKTLDHKENIRLSGDEAYQFDVADFLLKNRNEDFSINGRATVNNEKVSWRFSSNDYEKGESCNQFSKVVTAIEKIPFLGVSVTATDDFTGAEITQIIEGTTADNYALQVGDVITLINNTEISNTCDLTIALGQLEVGELVNIDLTRANRNETMEATLGYRLHKKYSWEANCEDTNIALQNAPETGSTDLSVYPNPTGGIVQFEYAATQKEAVQINITDFMGRTVLTKKVEEFSGFYQETLDLEGMQDGVYFLNVVQGEEVRTEKIVLQKG